MTICAQSVAVTDVDRGAEVSIHLRGDRGRSKEDTNDSREWKLREKGQPQACKKPRLGISTKVLESLRQATASGRLY